MEMKQRWLDLCKRLKLKGEMEAEHQILVARYEEPHRYYHNLRHVEHCLGQLDEFRKQLIKPDEVELALWFHDIIYAPGSKDNEELSAKYADVILARHGFSDSKRWRIDDLIMHTKHQQFPSERDSDARYLVDIDFSIMGAPEPKFIQTEQQIRKEYSMYTNEEFRQGRIKFLEGVLARAQIFSTPDFSVKYSEQARINLENALKRWAAKR